MTRLTLLSQRRNSILPHVDNPTNEDRWGFATYIADRAGVDRRSVAGYLRVLERDGLVESMPSGEKPSPFSDAPPKLWRTRRDES
jgi:predicted transcriptional regulator